jgi:hypothetical protein
MVLLLSPFFSHGCALAQDRSRHFRFMDVALSTGRFVHNGASSVLPPCLVCSSLHCTASCSPPPHYAALSCSDHFVFTSFPPPLMVFKALHDDIHQRPHSSPSLAYKTRRFPFLFLWNVAWPPSLAYKSWTQPRRSFSSSPLPPPTLGTAACTELRNVACSHLLSVLSPEILYVVLLLLAIPASLPCYATPPLLSTPLAGVRRQRHRSSARCTACCSQLAARCAVLRPALLCASCLRLRRWTRPVQSSSTWSAPRHAVPSLSVHAVAARRRSGVPALAAACDVAQSSSTTVVTVILEPTQPLLTKSLHQSLPTTLQLRLVVMKINAMQTSPFFDGTPLPRQVVCPGPLCCAATPTSKPASASLLRAWSPVIIVPFSPARRN